jgi:hypothetical protein
MPICAAWSANYLLNFILPQLEDHISQGKTLLNNQEVSSDKKTPKPPSSRSVPSDLRVPVQQYICRYRWALRQGQVDELGLKHPHY